MRTLLDLPLDAAASSGQASTRQGRGARAGILGGLLDSFDLFRSQRILPALVLAFGCIALGAFIAGPMVLGIRPAYLNELAPGALGSLFRGIVYQLGMLIGSPWVVIEFALQKKLGYPRGIKTFELGVVASLIVLFVVVPEIYGRNCPEVLL